MRNLFVFLFTTCSLLKEVLSIVGTDVVTVPANKTPVWYNYNNYSQSDIFYRMPIPTGSNYTSNNTCVNYTDLVSYNYTDYFEFWNLPQNVYPENFCYGMVTYNISREDFFNMINKNLNAFYNYRKLISLWSIYNYSTAINMDDSCAGYFRNVACWTEFPACVDNGDWATWTASPICDSYCSSYLLRCSSFAVTSFCNKTSQLQYCAGYMSANFLPFSIIKMLLILFIVII